MKKLHSACSIGSLWVILHAFDLFVSKNNHIVPCILHACHEASAAMLPLHCVNISLHFSRVLKKIHMWSVVSVVNEVKFKKKTTGRRPLGLPTDLRSCQLRGDMAVSLNNHYSGTALNGYVWGGSTRIPGHETMRLTAVTIIIEKSFFFWRGENAPIRIQTPDHKLIMLTL